ncbi:MAG TPA: N-acetylmuramoyl-L-alanine amidase [Bryobacteraceae bacterium]|nr:N-acetylmuramoyl-L-alanine amidase [Bryobacteraceae bacterium]
MPHLPPKHGSPGWAVAAVCLTTLIVGALQAQAASLEERGAGLNRVTDVRVWSMGDVTRIAIQSTGAIEFKYDRLENPDRLFFDLLDTRPERVSKQIQRITVADRFVKQIRIAETQHDVTRVVLDLKRASDFVTSRLENPDRLMIELRDPARGGTPSETDESADPPVFTPPPATGPVAKISQTKPLLDDPPVLTASADVPASLRQIGLTPHVVTPTWPSSSTGRAARTRPQARPLPAKGVASGEDSLTRVLGLKIRRIVIDPGHGGHDTGTIGANGMYEKDLVLDIAKRLGALIEKKMGAEVIFTRSDDTFIPLEERTRIANQAGADLFLSIHANSSETASASGIETYYLSFTTSKDALEVAARENASSTETVYDLHSLLQKIALKDKVDESREFAGDIQHSLYVASRRSNSRTRDRGVRKAPFVVLIGASMPSVLAEVGFISNPRDEKLMRQARHRQQIAESLYRGVAQYAGSLSHFQVAEDTKPGRRRAR